MGALLGLFILTLRKYLPESPRWLMTHGFTKEAEETTRRIECEVAAESGGRLEPVAGRMLEIYPRKSFGFGVIARTMFSTYRSRSILGLVLMISQAFLYNAVFFTYALILTRFYGVPAARTGIYLLPFALGNFLGPLLLGHFFDVIGRRQMISATYAISALLLAITGWAFSTGFLSANSQTALWTVIFFFASAAASSAYLTVSEIFPLEIRALAIDRLLLFHRHRGRRSGRALAIRVPDRAPGRGKISFTAIEWRRSTSVAAMVEALYGVKAERVSLEDLAGPLSLSDE